MSRTTYKDWITKDGLALIEGWAKRGLTHEQIANNIGIVRTTLYDWINKYSDISDALKKGKREVDIELENATFKSALGYTVEEKEVWKETKPDGTEVVKTHIKKRYIAPNVAAQIFLLKNRLPEYYRDKPEPKNEGGLVQIVDDI